MGRHAAAAASAAGDCLATRESRLVGVWRPLGAADGPWRAVLGGVDRAL